MGSDASSLKKVEEERDEYKIKYENEVECTKQMKEKENDRLMQERDREKNNHEATLRELHDSQEKRVKEVKEAGKLNERMFRTIQELQATNNRLLLSLHSTVKGPEYPLQRNGKGTKRFCLLINNSARDECESRMEELQSSFQQLQFEIRMENNLQKKDLKAALAQVATESDDYSCIVIALSSPAQVEKGEIILRDRTGGSTSLRDIWTPFAKNSEHEGKSKLLFLEIESNISMSRLNDKQYPLSMNPEQHDFIIAHSLGDGSGSKSFLGMIHEFLKQKSGNDIFSTLDDERQKECNPRFTLRSTFQEKVFLEE